MCFGAFRICQWRYKRVRDFEGRPEWNAQTSAKHGYRFTLPNEAHDTDFFSSQAENWVEEPPASYSSSVRSKQQATATSKICSFTTHQ